VTAAERIIGSFAGLNERELEILRLLASGHTVKTIAVQLGCSEASINERLRDARRKTGVGSSRELARLLGAQKIWDKNFDLSTQSVGVDNSPQPSIFGLNKSRGTMIMLFAIPLAAVGMILLAAPSMHGTAVPQSAKVAKQLPLDGSWSLDVARIPASERPRRVTVNFHPAQDGRWTTVVEIVSADGSIRRAESTAAVDGAPQPVTGNLEIADTVALRQPAPNTLVMTLAKNGDPVSTRVYTVSKDRRTMTETIIWAGRDVPKLETTYFNRMN
jgi:DNA-binding CsgD family transcriptional regulator